MQLLKLILILKQHAFSHWGIRLLKASIRGHATKQDVKDSKRWQTCVCGKQDARIPRRNDQNHDPDSDDASPLDYKLFHHGEQFYENVKADELVEAAEHLIAIENRAKEVIYDLTKYHTS